jgi:centromere/kinetochore protein ZW10
MIVSLDYHTTVTVGDEPFPSSMTGPLGQLAPGLEVFLLPHCAVSQTAQESMKLCRSTLDEAASTAQRLRSQLTSSPSTSSSSLSTSLSTAQWLLSILPLALYRSSRDVLDLFRSLVPALHGADIASLPRTAAIFHNDCVYMAHHCLTLGLEYKDLFPSYGEDGTEPDQAASDACTLLRQTCTFVDMVPLFRNLAEKALGTILDRHAKELVEIVGSRIPLFGPSLRSNEILQEWSDAESAVNAGLHHLRQLHRAWTPILTKDILRGSIWYLSDVVMGLLVEQVSAAKDISTSASQFVSSLFASASRGVLELVENDASASRVFDRFQAYGKFMDMSLADVQLALSDGGFRCVTGTSSNVLCT